MQKDPYSLVIDTSNYGKNAFNQSAAGGGGGGSGMAAHAMSSSSEA